MANGGWGGGIELAGCSLLMRVNVHVYERVRGGGGGVKRISCFDGARSQPERTVHVLYCGGVHYDALLVDSKDLAFAPAPAPRPVKPPGGHPAHPRCPVDSAPCACRGVALSLTLCCHHRHTFDHGPPSKKAKFGSQGAWGKLFGGAVGGGSFQKNVSGLKHGHRWW
jgi:hypothetical protein